MAARYVIVVSIEFGEIIVSGYSSNVIGHYFIGNCMIVLGLEKSIQIVLSLLFELIRRGRIAGMIL